MIVYALSGDADNAGQRKILTLHVST